jgi:hypothetical protein
MAGRGAVMRGGGGPGRPKGGSPPLATSPADGGGQIRFPQAEASNLFPNCTKPPAARRHPAGQGDAARERRAGITLSVGISSVPHSHYANGLRLFVRILPVF